MTRSDLKLDKRRRTYVRLIGEIRHALNQALTEEKLTQAQLAHLIGKDKSFVSKKLAGTSNMTLETLADLAYALNRPVKVTLPRRVQPGPGGQNIGPEKVAVTETQPPPAPKAIGRTSPNFGTIATSADGMVAPMSVGA